MGQSPNLFSGSIAYNIAYGEQSKGTEAEIQDDAELMVGYSPTLPRSLPPPSFPSIALLPFCHPPND